MVGAGEVSSQPARASGEDAAFGGSEDPPFPLRARPFRQPANLNYPQLLAHGSQDFQRARQLLLGMGCSDDGADTRLAVGYGGIADSLRENAGRKELTRKFARQRGFANDHGTGRR